MKERRTRIITELGAILARLPRSVLLVGVMVLLAAGATGLAGRDGLMWDSSRTLPAPSINPRILGSLFVVGVAGLFMVLARTWRTRIILFIGVIGVLFVLAILDLGVPAGGRDEEDEQSEDLAPRGIGDAPEPFWSWQVALAVAVVVAATALLLFLLLRQPSRIGDDPIELAGQEHAVIIAGLAALNENQNDRAAIIACYAAMEAALAGQGVRHRFADTPTEFLDRARSISLLTPAGEAAAETLVGLFNQARFSDRTLPTTARSKAESALTQLHEEFRTTTAVRPPRPKQ